jgi:hypothetical protein
MKANKANLSPGCRSVFDKTSFLPRLAPDLLNPRVRQFARDGVNPEKCADQVQNSAPSNDIGARVLKRGARKSGERLR